jgi:hypothetical protein
MARDLWNRLLARLGWSSRQAIVFLAFFYLLLFFPFTLEAGALNNALLWVTAVLILLYVVETHGVRMEIVRQNELAIQPLLIASIEPMAVQSNELKNAVVLRNIGHGPAFQVSIKEASNVRRSALRSIAHEPIDLIEAGKTIPVELSFNSITERNEFALLLDPGTPQQYYTIEISYKDIAMREYVSLMRMGKVGNVLLEHGKVGIFSNRPVI